MLKLAILCSGNLGLEILSKIVKKYKVVCVFTDKGSTSIVDFSIKENIPCFSGNPRKGNGYNFIQSFEIDVIISINYLFLIEDDIINYSNQLTFNIHGSLLPKYRGRTPHVWAIINGETKTGITAHLIDIGCDTGKIIHQIEIPIEAEDTGAVILNKYATEYFPLVEKVLNQLTTNTLDLKKQDESIASYFGKRTPEDGEINWNWSKTTIKNWVRAQADPYPGAFTYINNQKIIIDKVSIGKEIVNLKHYKNGEIFQTRPNIIIKVNDGTIILDRIRTEKCNFEIGKILGNDYR